MSPALPTVEEIGPLLQRISGSAGFARSERLRRFLRVAVERTLAGNTEALKESVLGVEVFDLAADYDPRLNPIVRVEARRLRRRLEEYFEGEGKRESWRIALPPGGYAAQFVRKAAPAPTKSAPASASPARPWVLATLAIVAVAAGVAVLWLWPESGPAYIPTPVRLTSDTGLSGDAVLTHDGRTLTFASDREGAGNFALWRQAVPDGKPVRLTGGPFDATEPDVSPDGKTLVFHWTKPPSGLWTMTLDGGEPSPLVVGGSRPQFSPDGRHILYLVRNERQEAPPMLFVVPAGGGPQQRYGGTLRMIDGAAWSPTGDRILVQAKSGSSPEDLWAIAFPGGEVRLTRLFAESMEFVRKRKLDFRQIHVIGPVNWQEGFLVYPVAYRSTSSLWMQPFDSRTARRTGDPMPLTSGTAWDDRVRVRGGQAVFSSGTIRSASFVLHLDGRRPDPEALLSTVDVQLQPSLSCDHRWLAYRRVLREEQQVVLRDRVSGEETVIGQGAHEASPLIAPDATRVAFRRGSSIEARPIPDGPPVTLCADCGAPLDWSPDGKRLLYERGGRPSAIGVLNLATGQPSIVVSDTERNLRRAKFSPDGRWIAFHEEDAAGSRIFAVNDAGDRVAIGPKGTSAGCPVWSTDGSLLYFLSNRSGKTAIWAQPLDPRTKQPRGEASLVFESPFSRRSFLEHMDGRHADVGFSLSGGALVFAMDEALANVWTIQLARR